MALFDILKEDNENSNERLNLMQNSHAVMFVSSQDDYLRKHLVDYELTAGNTAIHFTSNGRFALHDLIIFYARQLNGANVIAESFNVSEEAARKFLRAWDKGFFHSLKFILNSQKKHNFIKAVKLMEGRFPMHFRKRHSKCAVIWNSEYHITIISSGNLSSNQNEERGVIFFDKQTFDFDYKRMNDVFTA